MDTEKLIAGDYDDHYAEGITECSKILLLPQSSRIRFVHNKQVQRLFHIQIYHNGAVSDKTTSTISLLNFSASSKQALCADCSNQISSFFGAFIV